MDFLWYPTIFFISLGVAIWIAVFDINYALMDMENDIKNGIHSFPSKFGKNTTIRTSVQLTLLWLLCFALSDPMDEIWFLLAAFFMSMLNVLVIIFQDKLKNFQKILFRVSMLTGWILLASIFMAEPPTDVMIN